MCSLHKRTGQQFKYVGCSAVSHRTLLSTSRLNLDISVSFLGVCHSPFHTLNSIFQLQFSIKGIVQAFWEQKCCLQFWFLYCSCLSGENTLFPTYFCRVKIDEFDKDKMGECNGVNDMFSFSEIQLAHLIAFVEARYSYALSGWCFCSIIAPWEFCDHNINPSTLL